VCPTKISTNSVTVQYPVCKIGACTTVIVTKMWLFMRKSKTILFNSCRLAIFCTTGNYIFVLLRLRMVAEVSRSTHGLCVPLQIPCFLHIVFYILKSRYAMAEWISVQNSTNRVHCTVPYWHEKNFMLHPPVPLPQEQLSHWSSYLDFYINYSLLEHLVSRFF